MIAIYKWLQRHQQILFFVSLSAAFIGSEISVVSADNQEITTTRFGVIVSKANSAPQSDYLILF